MNKKYTKNEHMHYLNDGAEAIDPEAKKIIRDRLSRVEIDKRNWNAAPKHIGQWLQVSHRDAFNRDFERHVELHSLDKHCMS
jgi:hypothetical protein